jgi:long-chain acyl-CoA synthetase
VTADLAGLLAQAATGSGDRIALVDTGSDRRVTWAELDAEVDRVTVGLGRLGLVPGHRVVLALANRAEFVATYLGVLRAGMVAVPVNPRSATGELLRLLADCGARLVVADPTTTTSVRQAVAGLQEALAGADEDLRRGTPVPRVVVVSMLALPGETAYDDLLGPPADPATGAAPGARPGPPPGDPERLAVLLYTSGTSGRPRAAMLSHRALLANVEQTAAVDPPMVTGDDVVLGVLPLFHVYGLNAVLGQVLRRRARLVLVDGFDPEDALAVIEDEAVSVLPVAPPVFAHWRAVPDLRERLSGVRLVLSGSAPLSRELVEAFSAATGLDVHQGYGLTEAAPVVTSTLCSTRPAADLARAGSVGSAVPGVEVRLADEAGHPPEGGDLGEILVRGDNLFTGWWPDGAGGPDAEGWYATGDVGLLDPEGDLYLIDRLKELVIVSGFNVYPTEVEDGVDEVDGVAESAVIGAEHPRTGEMVIAYVRPGDDVDPEELAERVRAHCAVRLARFKQPSEVHVVAELPRTGTGKVAKGRLRSRRRQAHAGLLE